MVNKTLLNKTIGSGKNPFHNLTKDTDGDKVMNVMDCEPFNPKKQGFIHRAAAKVAGKAGFTKTAERLEERGREKDELRSIRRKERFEQEKETVRVREQERGKRLRKRARSGRTIATDFVEGFGMLAKSLPAPRTTTVTKRKGKKKKKVVKDVSSSPSIFDIKI